MSETLQELMRIRPALEDAIKAALVAGGISAINRSDIDFQRETPRAEIKCLLNAATGHRQVCPDGVVRYDSWRFSLYVQVVTFTEEAGVSAAHEDYIGVVRAVLSELAQKSWTDETNFPTVLIAEPLRDGTVSDTLKAEDGTEYSTLSFNSIVSVRQTAWPTT